MNNLAELITVAKYWQQWENPQWICAVFNNEDLNQVTWEQRVMEATPSSTLRSRFLTCPIICSPFPLACKVSMSIAKRTLPPGGSAR